jgi:hypothetical protein
MRWTRRSLDAAVRLKVEVPVVGRSHAAVDPCSRLTVLVSMRVFIGDSHRVESCVVTLDTYDGGNLQCFTPKGQVVVLL